VPLIRGGGQEKGHRSGTENPVALAGFAAAARSAADDFAARNSRIAGLRDAIEKGMRTATNDVIIHGADVERVANTCFFSLPGLKSETGQIAFDLEGIALSAGSACSSGKVGQSHVLVAMGSGRARQRRMWTVFWLRFRVSCRVGARREANLARTQVFACQKVGKAAFGAYITGGRPATR
jgi:cysteine sulfinate desulfinase/cysteine desulfurase-like protein